MSLWRASLGMSTHIVGCMDVQFVGDRVRALGGSVRDRELRYKIAVEGYKWFGQPYGNQNNQKGEGGVGFNF